MPLPSDASPIDRHHEATLRTLAGWLAEAGQGVAARDLKSTADRMKWGGERLDTLNREDRP